MVCAAVGLAGWLGGWLPGWLQIDDTMVLDPRNAALPVPVERYIGGVAVQEIRMLPYPHFPDLRGDSLNADSPITANLDQLTLNWVSPIRVDDEKLEGRSLTWLLRSSADSWRSADLNLIPDYGAFPATGFAEPGARDAEILAVAVEGRFSSFFRGRESPLASTTEDKDEPEGGETRPIGDITSVIERSPESARLVLVASNSFATDTAIELASQGLGTLYLRPAEFLQNAIDWSLEDRGLLALRGRSQLARTLEPLGEAEQRRWEYLNYGLALLGLLAVWGWRRAVAAADRRRYRQLLAEV